MHSEYLPDIVCVLAFPIKFHIYSLTFRDAVQGFRISSGTPPDFELSKMQRSGFLLHCIK